MERAFKMKLKAFFITFKGLSLKQIIFFLECESPTLSFSDKCNSSFNHRVYMRNIRVLYIKILYARQSVFL